MRARPVIGVATQTLDAVGNERPAAWVMGQAYVRSLVTAGAVPWLVPLLEGDEATLRALYARLDGLFLAGGVDIDPARYGEQRRPCCDRGDSARDWAELALVRWAVAESKPVFGVCRGVQAINVACGGSLYQDVGEEHPGALKHDWFPAVTGRPRDFLAHPVRIEPSSRLAAILGATELPVNSMHHQGIRQLAPGLVATAFAPDGIVEGIERPGGYLIGVQWHPEEMPDAPVMRRLFEDFIEAAGAFGRR